jgi:MFS transporter, DHA1 family, tetracycline resistance protein
MLRSRLLVFSVLTGVFASGYGVMFTVLDDYRDTYGISAAALGAVVAVGFFASFLAQIFLAPLADRGFARRLVVIGMAINVVGLIGMGFGTTLSVLLISRIVTGIATGLALPAMRRIVILSDPENLGRNVGNLLAFDVAGFAFGPAISAVLVGPFGIAAPFLVIAAIMVGLLPIVARFDVDESERSSTTNARFAFDLLASKPYVGALCLGAGLFVMIGTFDALWVLVLDDLRTADWIANLGIVLFAVPMVLLSSYGGRLSQRVGPFRVGSVGLIIASVFMFMYGHLPSGAAMFAVAMVHALNDGLTVSSSGIAVGMVSPDDRMAGAQGLLGGTQTLVGGIAALTAGLLYEAGGRAIAYTVCAVVVFVLAVFGWRLGRHATPTAVDTVPACTSAS